jgi:hypothetical protein
MLERRQVPREQVLHGGIAASVHLPKHQLSLTTS